MESAQKPAAEAPQATADATATLIDNWFVEHFHQPPISHQTECYNQALAAKDALKAKLAKKA